MTNEEATNEIVKLIEYHALDMDEPLNMAVSALEKQIPKQVGVDGYGWYECSECHNKRPNWLLHKNAKWCPYCGQKICWEEENNNEKKV